MTQASDRLEQVYQARTSEQLREAYQVWAEHYDQDLVGELGWDKPARVGEVVLEHTPATARVLDVGTGTGLVGAFLAAHGYHDLTGLDFCPAMLEQARRRGCYRELLEADLRGPLELPEASFELVLGVGIFTEGHLGPDCLSELVRVASGQVVFSLRDDLLEGLGFALEQERLAQLGHWRLAERRQFSGGLKD